MAQRIDVGSAEFKMLMELDEFRKAAEQQAPEIAARGAKKTAEAVEKGAKQGAEGMARETKKGVDAAERELKRQADIAAREAKRAADAQAREAQRAATQTKQALNSAFAIGAGAAGVNLGVGGAIQGIQGIADATKEKLEAQFALTKVFGANAQEMAKFSDELAESIGGNTNAMQLQLAKMISLSKQYGLTRDQIKELTKSSADLGAVMGIDTVDAMERIVGAFRDGGESTEKLALALSSTGVQAFTEMTDAQRKNFETLDPLTKSQLIYKAIVEQAGFATGAAAERAESALGTFDRFGASMKTLGANIGEAVLPELTIFVKHLNDIIKLGPEAAKAIDELRNPDRTKQENILGFASAGNPITGLLNPDLVTQEILALLGQRQSPGAIRAAQAAFSGGDVRKSAATVAGDQTDAINAARAARRQFDEEKKRQLDELDKIEKERTQSNLKNLQEGQKESIDLINQRKDAAIKAADAERDANVKAAEASRDAALAALEQEQEARQRVRLQQDRALADARQSEDRGISAAREAEDRARERSNAAQLTALEKERDTAVRNQEAIIDGIDRKKDAALRAIDDERDAEDRRHQEALDNLEREKDARVGEIDEQLRALSDQERGERRAEREQSLRQGLSDAQRNLKEARKDGSPDEIRRARRDVARAQDEIRRNERDNQREDLRQSLNDQKAAILAEIDERKRAEQDKSNAIKAGLQDRKDTIQAGAEEEINAARDAKDAIVKSYQERADAIKAEQQAKDEAIKDQRLKEDQALSDSRTAQDRAIADQRTAEDNAHQVSIQEVQRAYQQKTQDIAAEYEKQKTAAEQAAQDQIKKVNSIFQAHAEGLRRQENNWILLRNAALNNIDDIGDALIDAVDGNAVRQAFRNLQTQYRNITGGAAGGSTAGGSAQSQTPIYNAQRTSSDPYSSYFQGGNPSPNRYQNQARAAATVKPSVGDIDRYLVGLGWDVSSQGYKDALNSMWQYVQDHPTGPWWAGMTVTGMARGGFISEPSLIVSKRTGRAYAEMAEGGRGEYIVPQDRMGWGGVQVGSISVRVDGTGKNAEQIAREVGPLIVEQVVDALEATQVLSPDPAPRYLAGAN